jgi:lipopolysaccharide export system protein LptC
MAIDLRRRLLDRLVGLSPLLLLGGLAALTYWLDAQIQPLPPKSDGSSRHDPDLFIKNVRGTTFDAQGRPRQKLEAERAEHFPDDDTVALAGLSMSLTEPDRPAVSASADRGVVAGDRESMTLEGRVRVVRAGETARPGQGRESSGPVTITTEYLRIVPKQGVAETDRPVTIEEPRGIIHSVGIRLDNEAKTLKLKSNVQGTLQPNANPK